ncbi:MAG: alpha/beta hydrolase [Propionibacteriaceae bacterium]|nr:alpha/beta hydrolase [Propionibacteriaceae bacterium]
MSEDRVAQDGMVQDWMAEERLVETTRGQARVELRVSEASRALLVMGPGASGRPASDLFALADAVHAAGFSVALVTPPYAVAGRKIPPRGTATDEAFVQVVAALREELGDQPLITGGRSFGSRVACRTSAEIGSIGVLCLAFPLHPPGKPEQSRLEDLEAATVPTLVVQGRSDAFGIPPEAEHRQVLLVDGDHSLRKDHERIGAAVVDWLESLLTAGESSEHPQGEVRLGRRSRVGRCRSGYPVLALVRAATAATGR